MSNGIIYKATSKTSNKSYIGQTTKGLERRKVTHKSFRKNRKLSHFQKAILKYGFEDFVWSVLIDTDSKDLNDLEKFYIKEYNSINNGYNMSPGGDSVWLGMKHTEESKKRMSLSAKSRITKPHSQDTKNKMSKAARGKKKSIDHINRIAAARAQDFKIIKPNGDIEIIKNLSKYCRENGLIQRKMSEAAKRGWKHRGYRCIKLESEKVKTLVIHGTYQD